MGVVGAGVTAYSQLMAGQEAASAQEYNQQLYRQQAEAVEASRKLEAGKAERLKRKITGEAMTRTAAAGISPTGSPMAVMLDNLTQAQLDKSIVDYNLQVEKSRYLSAAEMAGMEARSSRRQGIFGAISTLLTEGNRLFMRYGSQPKMATTERLGGLGSPLADPYAIKTSLYGGTGSTKWFTS